MKNFLIVDNPSKDNNFVVLKRVIDYCKAENIENSVSVLKSKDHTIDESLLKDADIILCLGGDGTLMKVAKQSAHYNKPIIGINTGHLGFLTQAGTDNIEGLIHRLKNDDFYIEKRMMVSGTVERNGRTMGSKTALNDVVISRDEVLRVLTYDISVNGKFLKTYSADGVIVATPTGSTGYSFSAGGPVVEPGAENILLTPISPHSFMNRSIVFKESDEICITINRAHNIGDGQAVVSFDGDSTVKLLEDDRVYISKSDVYASFIQINNINFLENLNKKMQES